MSTDYAFGPRRFCWLSFRSHSKTTTISLNSPIWVRTAYVCFSLYRRKPDRQRTYDATMKRVRVTIVAVKKQKALNIPRVCVCSLRYPACNAHAPYCHVWPVRLYNIFPHHLIKDMIFVKMLLNTKCVFWFSLRFLSATFLILRRTERDTITNVYRSSRKVP
jgi:hypothetical protein